jgi:thiamine-phosphate pyrophosphorylase
LRALLPEVDVVQVRCKPRAESARSPGTPGPPAEARATYEWARRALALCAELERPPLLLVDDRVDVALALRDQGCAGVHLGTHDFPIARARELLGSEALIGLSTHCVAQVVRAEETSADYLGFGPLFATATQGYRLGLGPETAWVAQTGSGLPLFPIGGIDLGNVHTLHLVGRAAVSSALLGSEDPARMARLLCEALGQTD